MGQLVSDVSSVLDYNQSKKEARSQRAEILRQMAADNQAKNNLVKKTLASQRAKYGAAGMSGGGITEEAVLKRLKAEAEEPYNEKQRINATKLKNINVKKPNLLTQLLSRFDKLVG